MFQRVAVCVDFEKVISFLFRGIDGFKFTILTFSRNGFRFTFFILGQEGFWVFILNFSSTMKNDLIIPHY